MGVEGWRVLSRPRCVGDALDVVYGRVLHKQGEGVLGGSRAGL